MPDVEQRPASEMQPWIPAPDAPPAVEVVLPPGQGRLAPADPRTRAIASLGGQAAKAKRAQLKAITGLGVSETSELMTDPKYKEYVEAALAFAKHEIERLARDVGGGACPPPAAACVVAAARAMLWSSYYAGKCEAKLSMAADTSMKQQLLCAHELCLAEARLRKNKKSSHAKIEDGLKALGAWDDNDTAERD